MEYISLATVQLLMLVPAFCLYVGLFIDTPQYANVQIKYTSYQLPSVYIA
jgi:hypothetical protein